MTRLRRTESAPRRVVSHPPALVVYTEASNAHLYRIARDRKISGRCRMSRDELIAILERMDRQ